MNRTQLFVLTALSSVMGLGLGCSSPGGGGGRVPTDGVSFGDSIGGDTSVGTDTTTPVDTSGPACSESSPCPGATPICFQGRCVECTQDGQCEGGGRCANFACLSDTCTPGTASCNGSVRLVCNASGDGYDTLPCDGRCEGGVCVGCDAGERRCEGTTVVECKADGTTYDPVALCAAGQVCSDGKCMNCYPSQRRCGEAGLAEECNADGQWQFKQDCNSEGLSCLLGTCVSPCVRDPKSKSNSGCDYWAIDLDNHYAAQNGPFAVIISNLSEVRATVTVTRKDNAGLQPAEVVKRDVNPGQLSIFDLPNRNMSAAGTFWTAYRIESTAPIVAYQFNPLDNVDVFSNDASLLIPANTLGREYFVMSRFEFAGAGPTSGATIPYRGTFSVAAASTQTTVTIVPSARTLAGANMAAMTAGQSYTYTLDPYQVLNVKSNQDKGDLTGSLVTSDKPVAVFAGHEAALSGSVCCADHLEHQMFPVATWGTSYIATKSKTRQSEEDYYRIIASENGTSVTFTPSNIAQPRTLNRGQWFEISTTQDFVIDADKPISVGHLLASSGEVVTPPAYSDCVSAAQCAHGYTCEVYDLFGGLSACFPPTCTPGFSQTCPAGHVCSTYEDGTSACTAVGDPTLIMLPPVKQFRKDYVFLTPNKYAFDYVNLVAPVAATVTLDGINVPPANFVQIPGGLWKVARVEVADGTHKVVASEAIGVIVYGYDRDVSYGYAGGLNLVDGE